MLEETIERKLGNIMFKSEKELELWESRLGLNEEARALIQTIRISEPARKVQSGRNNVSGQYPSLKMGHTLQFESHRCELAFIQMMERDEKFIEIWDQPVTFKKFSYKAKNGRRWTGPHTPDFFVCHEEYAGFIENKTEEELVKLAVEMPNRYSKGDDGEWRCPPGEAYVGKFGFRYLVQSTAKINTIYIRNLVFFDDYLRNPSLMVEEEAKQFILSLVRSQPGISLSELLNHVLEA